MGGKGEAYCVAAVFHVASSAISVSEKPPTEKWVCAGVSSAKTCAEGQMRTSELSGNSYTGELSIESTAFMYSLPNMKSNARCLVRSQINTGVWGEGSG